MLTLVVLYTRHPNRKSVVLVQEPLTQDNYTLQDVSGECHHRSNINIVFIIGNKHIVQGICYIVIFAIDTEQIQ